MAGLDGRFGDGRFGNVIGWGNLGRLRQCRRREAEQHAKHLGAAKCAPHSKSVGSQGCLGGEALHAIRSTKRECTTLRPRCAHAAFWGTVVDPDPTRAGALAKVAAAGFIWPRNCAIGPAKGR